MPRKSATEYMVSSGDAEVALQVAKDLGIEVTTTEIRGAGGMLMTSISAAKEAWNNPYIQGAFLGFLVSRGIVIETKEGDVIVTIKNLGTLKHLLKELIR
jgi:predicted deacylase